MKRFEGFMRGVNLGGWLSQCKEYSEQHYMSFITKEDIKAIAGMGLGHLRLPIDYLVIEDESGAPIESGYRHIDDCIEWCREYGLNIILDLHKTRGFAFDEKTENNTMFDDPALRSRFISLWINIAKRYAGEENVAFELLNEVTAIDSGIWNSLIREALSDIRRIAPDRTIIVGGTHWNSVHTLRLLDIPLEKIVYNFHFYEPFLFTHQLAPWHPLVANRSIRYPGDIEEYRRGSAEIGSFGSGLKNARSMGAEFMDGLISEAVEAAEAAGVPLYCGEYGVIDRADIDDTAVWYRDIHSVLERHGIGRAAWSYKEMDFGITDDHYLPRFDEIVSCL